MRPTFTVLHPDSFLLSSTHGHIFLGFTDLPSLADHSEATLSLKVKAKISHWVIILKKTFEFVP